MEDESLPKDAYCIVDGLYGVHIPKRFAEIARGYIRSNYKALESSLIFLEDSDNQVKEPDAYFEIWESVLESFWFEDYNGKRFRIMQDQDVFAYPEEN